MISSQTSSLRLSSDGVEQPSRVCQVVACVNENIGGPALSVTSLAEALAQHQVRSHLWTLNYPHLGPQLCPAHIQIHSYPATLLTRYCRGYHPAAYRALQELAAQELDIIHNHGVWMFPNTYARQAAQFNNLPLVISPRGMLEAWSLQYGRTYKRLAWHLYEHRNLQRATLFHATSVMEATSIRQLGFQQQIAVLPNGVTIPSLENLPSREVLTQHFPELSDKQWLLFLGRLHPKKGLENLLKVWQSLTLQFPDWQLILAGSDLIGYQAKLVDLAVELGIQHRVSFVGMLGGNEKVSALANADLFVLPSHSENFGIAVAEALSYCVPVITTQGTPWEEIQDNECGWWIEDTTEALSRSLQAGMQLSVSKRHAMGLRGRELVTTRYSWTAIAQSMSEVYHWLLQGGTPPTCVQPFQIS